MKNIQVSLTGLLIVFSSLLNAAELVERVSLLPIDAEKIVDVRRKADSGAASARPGDKLVLRLAVSGPYEITIDAVRQSPLSNTIIRGTTQSGGSSLMVIGADGSVRGHFERPGELVQVSSGERGIVTAWVEGVDAKMLPINDDGNPLAGRERRAIAGPSIEKFLDAAAPTVNTTSSEDVSYARFKTGQSNIRILIYYQDSMIEIGTIADYLVELTNLAFEASEVSVTLVVAALKPVALDASLVVNSVYRSMLDYDSPFEDIAQDMSNHNAVMAATIIGGVSPAEETAGGIASIGGKFSTSAFSVTRYRGLQEGDTALYPSYAFAHEIGHNLGANHNREMFSNNGGNKKDQFSYAFGYLIEGVQRTIMSYKSDAFNEAEIPHFSNPGVKFNSRFTGIAASTASSAFVARAFTNNRHVPASKIAFGAEALTYSSYVATGGDDCGIYRAMALNNESSSNIAMHSANYVSPDGSVTSLSLAGIELSPGTYIPRGFCRPESEANPLGTTYTESFFRYYHPTNGELIEGPHFQWRETYIPQSEVRIAYTDGGKLIGNTVRMVPVDEDEDIVFEPAQGFSLGEIKSTCEGYATANGFHVTATIDPCLVEASFLSDQTPSTNFRVQLEEPVEREIHTGIGNLRGWAVADSGIDRVEIWIDDEYAFDVPYGGARGDVGNTFSNIVGSGESGFSMAFAYSALAAGAHTAKAVAYDSSGSVSESAVSFSVVKFEESFIADPNAVDLSNASCSVSGDEVSITDAVVSSDPLDMLLKWRGAEQGFEIVEIHGSGAGVAMFQPRQAMPASDAAANTETPETIPRVTLEEPVNAQIHSGVGNLRGWAVASQGIEKIEIYIDGGYVFDAPYGGARGDVGAAFPEVPNATESGFSLAFAYSNLAAGTHTIEAVARATDGQEVRSAATFEVVKFAQNFISDPQAVNLDMAACTTEGDEITIIGAVVAGETYDMVLDWRTAEQGFEVVEIR